MVLEATVYLLRRPDRRPLTGIAHANGVSADCGHPQGESRLDNAICPAKKGRCFHGVGSALIFFFDG